MAYDDSKDAEYLRLSNRQEDIRKGRYRGKDPSESVSDPITIQDVIWERATEGERGGRSRAPELAQSALSEKHPTAGGTYKGSVYFSNILPEGKGDIPWTKEAANIVKKASQPGAKKSHILAAQNYFADIGYMHPSEVDGKPGKQFHGMVSRWNKNAGVSKEAMFDAMKTWKDNLFDGGAEDFEEDLREGGGDQGGY